MLLFTCGNLMVVPKRNASCLGEQTTQPSNMTLPHCSYLACGLHCSRRASALWHMCGRRVPHYIRDPPKGTLLERTTHMPARACRQRQVQKKPLCKEQGPQADPEFPLPLSFCSQLKASSHPFFLNPTVSPKTSVRPRQQVSSARTSCSSGSAIASGKCDLFGKRTWGAPFRPGLAPT